MNQNGQTPVAAPYPGLPTTADGSGTVSWVETQITQAHVRFLSPCVDEAPTTPRPSPTARPTCGANI